MENIWILQLNVEVISEDCSENSKHCLRSSNTGWAHIWRKLLYFRPTITFLLAAGREVAKIGLKYQPVTYGDLYSSWSDIKKTIVFRFCVFLFIVGYFSGDHSSNFFLKIQFFIFQIEGNTFEYILTIVKFYLLNL